MQLPAVWVMAAVGALLGLLPRLVVGATWAVLAVVLFVTMFGEPLQLDQWVLDLSPFAHLPRLPAAAFTATPWSGCWPPPWCSRPPAWPASAAATWSAAPDRTGTPSPATGSATCSR